MLINLSEVFTLEGKEKTWEVPFEAKAYKGSRVEYPVVSANPVKITVKNLGNRKLSLTGNTSVTLAIPCSRCLEPVISVGAVTGRKYHYPWRSHCDTACHRLFFGRMDPLSTLFGRR